MIVDPDSKLKIKPVHHMLYLRGAHVCASDVLGRDDVRDEKLRAFSCLAAVLLNVVRVRPVFCKSARVIHDC